MASARAFKPRLLPVGQWRCEAVGAGSLMSVVKGYSTFV